MARHAEVEVYTVGWLCALPIELAAARMVLDEEYKWGPSTADSNIYTFGRIGDHGIAIACLPAGRYGTSSAAAVASPMMSTFPNLRSCLMVGIGGGVPSGEADIRLGDVVVSRPMNNCPGVVQYDMGKRLANGQLQRVGALAPPSSKLLQATAKLQTNQSTVLLSSHLSESPRRPKSEDVLFTATYKHVSGKTCSNCLMDRSIQRALRYSNKPYVHYGIIASGNLVVKDGMERERLKDDIEGIRCFEMEAAGLMNDFPCLVIRGICNYADTHKNKEWQSHAAGVAAAYAKELLAVVPPAMVMPPKIDLRTKLENDQTRCLEVLSFPEMNMREYDIDDETLDTCLWLPAHSTFKLWSTQQQKLLWIQGKPGAGKSTLMRFLLKREREKRDSDGHILLSFFFHGRAGNNSMRNSILGLYQSLLCQIFKQIPALCESFLNRFEHLLYDVKAAPYNWTRHEKELRNVLKELVLQVSRLNPIRMYIDALDESGKETAKDLVIFFKSLNQVTMQMKTLVKICFSSRYYPIVNPEDYLAIRVEDENNHDLTLHIDEKLLNKPPAFRLGPRILQKARGLFQWVVLVVQMIADMYQEGDYGHMEDRLEELPESLELLYETILNDLTTNDTRRSTRLIRWLSFALEPVSLEAMRWAIMIDGDCLYDSLADLESDASFAFTNEQLRKQLRSLSCGLVEIIEYECSEVVQFIHQSVRDYSVERGFERLGHEAGRGEHHFQLFRACIRYLKMQEISSIRLLLGWPSRLVFRYKDEQKSINVPGTWSTSLFPLSMDVYLWPMSTFFEYVAGNCMRHAQIAEAENVCLGRILDLLSWPPCGLLDVLALHENGPSFKWRCRGHRYIEDNNLPQCRTTLLHHASFFSLQTLVDAILTSELETADSEDSSGERAISWAARSSRPVAWTEQQYNEKDGNDCAIIDKARY
ncbi:MAG: hypothetical protein M1820_005084 [Bogoriella megaspora]|nr:MAG: hypothetical protein M1820_005084 [Bogoriella megaspora]